ncbi:MAG: hypothetical protein J0H73_10750, partial [Salana multivorans]|nr:hypothetical protein [Salana multivorans]
MSVSTGTTGTLTSRVRVWVSASDPISLAGVMSALRSRPELSLVRDPDANDAEVAVVVTDRVDEQALRAVRSARRNHGVQVVLVCGRLGDDDDVVAAVEAGALGLVRRSE